MSSIAHAAIVRGIRLHAPIFDRAGASGPSHFDAMTRLRWRPTVAACAPFDSTVVRTSDWTRSRNQRQDPTRYCCPWRATVSAEATSTSTTTVRPRSPWSPTRSPGAPLPCVLGHELSGWVLGVGEHVDDLPIGALVAVEPIETCGDCPRCRSGRRHLCRKLAFHGYNRAGGGLAERTVVRRDMVHLLPDGLTPLHGALVEPMAVSRHAVRRARARAGEIAVVSGAGPIGLGALLALMADGVPVVMVDPSPTRRAAATQLGAQFVLDPTTVDVVACVRDLTSGAGAGCSIEASGAESALTAALRSTRPDGTVVLVAHHRVPYPLRSASLIFTEVMLTGSLIYDDSDFRWVIDAMQRGVYPLDDWVTEIPLAPRRRGRGLAPLRAQRANKVVVRLAVTP